MGTLKTRERALRAVNADLAREKGRSDKLLLNILPREDGEHAVNIVRSAVEMIQFLEQRNRTADFPWEVRIGIHTGEVVGGVVGTKKYIYDVFGAPSIVPPDWNRTAPR